MYKEAQENYQSASVRRCSNQGVITQRLGTNRGQIVCAMNKERGPGAVGGHNIRKGEHTKQSNLVPFVPKGVTSPAIGLCSHGTRSSFAFEAGNSLVVCAPFVCSALRAG